MCAIYLQNQSKLLFDSFEHKQDYYKNGHHIFLLSRKAGYSCIACVSEDSLTDSIQPDLRVKVKAKPEADAIKTHLYLQK